MIHGTIEKYDKWGLEVNIHTEYMCIRGEQQDLPISNNQITAEHKNMGVKISKALFIFHRL